MPKTNNAFIARAETSVFKTRFFRFYFSVWLPIRIILFSVGAVFLIIAGVIEQSNSSTDYITYEQVSLSFGIFFFLLDDTMGLSALLSAREMHRSYRLNIINLYVQPILSFGTIISLGIATEGSGEVIAYFSLLEPVFLIAAIPVHIYFRKRSDLFGPLIGADRFKRIPCALCGDNTPGNGCLSVRVADGYPKVFLCKDCMNRCSVAPAAELPVILRELYHTKREVDQ